MIFKIGDKVRITDRSFSVELRNNKYNKHRSCDNDNMSGVVLAIDCRLPFTPTYEEHGNCPLDGVKLLSGSDAIFNNLIIQVKDGFVFTSSRFVKLAGPKKYLVSILGVEIEVTKDQYEAVEASEDSTELYYTGTVNEEDWE